MGLMDDLGAAVGEREVFGSDGDAHPSPDAGVVDVCMHGVFAHGGLSLGGSWCGPDDPDALHAFHHVHVGVCFDDVFERGTTDDDALERA